MAINYGLSDKSKAGRRLLAQVMAARQLAEMKRNRRFNPEKSDKRPYEPGKLGLSAVSEAIKKEFGMVINRRTRRKFARISPFQAFYNGDGPVRTPHNIRPSKYGTWNRR